MLTLKHTIQHRTDEGWPLIAEQIQPGLLSMAHGRSRYTFASIYV